MSDDRPDIRQWWLCQPAWAPLNRLAAFPIGELCSLEKLYHVIEKSAYDAKAKECEGLGRALAKNTQAWLSEREALSAKLSVALSELADTRAAASIHADEHRKVRAENERLRAALEKISMQMSAYTVSLNTDFRGGVTSADAIKIAREALQGDKPNLKGDE